MALSLSLQQPLFLDATMRIFRVLLRLRALRLRALRAHVSASPCMHARTPFRRAEGLWPASAVFLSQPDWKWPGVFLSSGASGIGPLQSSALALDSCSNSSGEQPAHTPTCKIPTLCHHVEKQNKCVELWCLREMSPEATAVSQQLREL